MDNLREEIEEVLVDAYGEDEQMSAWEVTFMDNVSVPFQATLLDIPVEVQGFRLNNTNVIQCQIQREQKQRWVSVQDLDDDSLPEDFRHVLKLYCAWIDGEY